MKQSLLNEVQTKLRNKKIIAEKTANENLGKALENQDFKNLYSALNSTIIENAKLEAYNKTPNKELEKSLHSQINKILKTLNINNIAPTYSCAKCEDSGIFNGEYCSCLKNEITKILLEKSNFGKLEKFKDSNFSIFENKEEMEKIYNLMQKWCNKKDSEKNLIYLVGSVGTGKTHLMRCMANEFINQNKITLLTSAFSLSQEFINYHTSKEKKDALSNLLDCEVLFIDDLGTEPFYNNVTREYTYLLINERRMRNLKTVITSNLQPRELMDKYDERIFSRIVDKSKSIVLELKGSDKRLLKK